ncbi:four-carbon acid sugar kinase family protein [Clostridium arbusti]|uniref:four-carbon acid sugar kinase family protein n=1 Tax=Clostridium arbusti TaxID=1137848 RepID=UPI0002881E53|nr:four-carbon acid sugar kinase family protein [Clostridium arbusti]
MLKTVIIADDLTGANDTGALLAKNGLKVGTLLQESDLYKFKDFDVLSITTNSRGLAPEDAYKKVKDAVNLFTDKENIFFSKRIDSTLRGNVGYEIDSIIESLGSDITAIVVASFPDSGRVSIGDLLLVNGVPLEKTEVVKDPTSPVNTSKITEIVKKQSKYKIGFIPLDKVLKGSDVIKQEILKNAQHKNRIIVIDACTNNDINEIAKASVESKVKFISVDPGPFTAAAANMYYKKDEKLKTREKVLCGIGSASNLTREQINYLKVKYNPLIMKTNTLNFLQENKKSEEINRIVNEIVNREANYNILIITTTTDEKDVLDFVEIEKNYNLNKKQCSNLITSAIAEILYLVIENLGNKIGSVYTSGGDVTEDFCNKIKADGIDVKDEVIPLAIYGRVIGGVFDNKPIITKGGLVGSKDTLSVCINYLKTKTSTEYSNRA